MEYMLLVCDDETIWDRLSEEESTEVVAGYRAFSDQVGACGVLVNSGRLQPTTIATSVQIRDGNQLVTDGPFAETKEQLGGYYLVDVESLDDAIALAAQIPSAKLGTIEVRPIMQMPVRSGT